jgi:hypothetical protein
MKREYIIDVPGFADFYQILGVELGVSFTVMKKAYYAKAKECHPDVNPDAQSAEAQFRDLVNAFDVLSDPDKRRQYDTYLRRVAESADYSRTEAFTYSPSSNRSIMDTLADDILEELIVSNDFPKGSTMQTLMRDLEQTDTFMTFREAKNLFARGQFAHALHVLKQLCGKGSGLNILHHYYLGRCGERLRRWRLADKHYRICISIGKHRVPIQHLANIRCRLYDLRKKHRGLLGTLRNMISGNPPRPMISAADEMVDDTSRAISQLLSSQHSKKRIGTDRQLK